MRQNLIHPSFRINIIPDLVEQLSISVAGAANVGLPFLQGLAERLVHQGHDQIIVLRISHSASPYARATICGRRATFFAACAAGRPFLWMPPRSEEHTSELQSLRHLVCRLLL